MLFLLSKISQKYLAYDQNVEQHFKLQIPDILDLELFSKKKKRRYEIINTRFRPVYTWQNPPCFPVLNRNLDNRWNPLWNRVSACQWRAWGCNVFNWFLNLSINDITMPSTHNVLHEAQNKPISRTQESIFDPSQKQVLPSGIGWENYKSHGACWVKTWRVEDDEVEIHSNVTQLI